MPRVGKTWFIYLVLGLGSIGLYWPAIHFEFFNLDDLQYITTNTVVQQGVTKSGVIWALRSYYAGNWHPVTWISHMLDCGLYGLSPGGHHLTNILFHAANSVLLLLVLRQLTRATWQSAFVAALFAWHPLHVESVAWVSERKDVLSAFFGILTIWAYAAYAEREKEEGRREKEDAAQKTGKPQGNEQKVTKETKPPLTPALSPSEGERENHPPSSTLLRSRRSWTAADPRLLWYLLALFFFALGLMSKPMLVTLPFVLLLLDYWPLKRVTSDEWRVASGGWQEEWESPSALRSIIGLVGEKLPFFALAGTDCVLTMWAQKGSSAVVSLTDLPFWNRVANACVSYVAYLGKTFWPSKLSVIYPYSDHLAPAGAARAIAALLIFSFFVLRETRRRPYLFVGWFWFVGTLVPVIGLVQVGVQSFADRYTYIPLIGIFIMVAWGVGEGVERWGKSEPSPLVLLPSDSSRRSFPTEADGRGQPDRGGEAVAPEKFAGQSAIALIIGAAGMTILITLAFCSWKQLRYWRNSITLFAEAAKVTKNNILAEYGLGDAFQRLGDYERAKEHYQNAIGFHPSKADMGLNWQNAAYCKLGGILSEQGRFAEAEAQFKAGLRMNPQNWQICYTFGDMLTGLGRLDEAVGEYLSALQMVPENSDVWRRLGVALARKGDSQRALRAYRQAVRLNPDGPLELNDLAWFLATDPHEELRDGVEALKLARRACELTGKLEPRCLGTLDAAYAEAGLWKDAIETAETARQVAYAQGQTDVAAAAGQRLELYRAGKPYRQR